jgi:hypothetical protein
MFLDLLFSKLDLYVSGSQIHERTTPPGSWAFQLSAATSYAAIRPPEGSACSSRAYRSSSKPPFFYALRFVFLFVFFFFLEESSSSLGLDSSSIQTLLSRPRAAKPGSTRARAWPNNKRAEPEQPRLELGSARLHP